MRKDRRGKPTGNLRRATATRSEVPPNTVIQEDEGSAPGMDENREHRRKQ